MKTFICSNPLPDRVIPYCPTNSFPFYLAFHNILLGNNDLCFPLPSNYLEVLSIFLRNSSLPQRVHMWSVQFISVAQLCPTLYNPMNCSTPGLPVHHQYLEFTQTHVHQVGDAIQPSHPLPSPSPPAPNPSQHQGLFQWVNSSHQVAKVLEFQLQHQPFQRTPRTDL